MITLVGAGVAAAKSRGFNSRLSKLGRESFASSSHGSTPGSKKLEAEWHSLASVIAVSPQVGGRRRKVLHLSHATDSRTIREIVDLGAAQLNEPDSASLAEIADLVEASRFGRPGSVEENSLDSGATKAKVLRKSIAKERAGAHPAPPS